MGGWKLCYCEFQDSPRSADSGGNFNWRKRREREAQRSSESTRERKDEEEEEEKEILTTRKRQLNGIGSFLSRLFNDIGVVSENEPLNNEFTTAYRHTRGSQKVIRRPLLPEWRWQRRCCGRPSFSGREWIRRPGRVTAICRSSSTLPPFAAMTGLRGVVTDVDPLPPNYAIATAGGDSGTPETSGGASGIQPCRSRQLLLLLRHFSRELIHRR
ncbi:hypothetical protein DAPPUDRAFT_101991 [Daphnia pulex]|uniref:Uncharacterized protein n=1 Tax=Daphnia pulex TaxID=6669 RepID=E9GF24_DAPPU|nr:hypothetical protein DAPPUDRAFT_101991 [Daphnia pulex]|eukprot:EFX81932.1 hypothetical protein DAPPUDRAFT_101991 [Daphnia pulex]